MAIIKKPAYSSSDSRVSRRKATSQKKTAKVKTKLTKRENEAVAIAKAITQEQEQAERIATARRQRVVEKAMARTSLVPAAPLEVAAVKITDVSGVVYDKAEYDAMVAMYDSTIKDIKEGEIVHGKVLGVTLNDVIVDVGFKSEGIIPITEFSQPLNIKVGDPIEVFLEQIED